MGGLGKYFEKIDERRLENGACITFEYQYPQVPRRSPDVANDGIIPPDQIVKLRDWVRDTNRRCAERLAREMVVVFGLSKDRTRIWVVGYMTKAEASALEHDLIGGMLLDLDSIYGGFHVFGDHLFVSDAQFVDGLNRYGSDLTATKLVIRMLEERRAQRNRQAA